MPRLYVRRDHTVRVFPAVLVDDDQWCAKAVLTITKDNRSVVATSPRCRSPEAAYKAAMTLVRHAAGLRM
ncbi:hypothetical protein [Teichococcus deserti]|uniref:hypothetical protein n=1 Tax=Teichococcus deserti TaxID=1817963 RepID=UPI0010549547|nr:hypothetical protein [Pseudoroseomonas deserti]